MNFLRMNQISENSPDFLYHIKIDRREALSGKFSGSAKSEIKEELAKTGLMRTTIKRRRRSDSEVSGFQALSFSALPGKKRIALKMPDNPAGRGPDLPPQMRRLPRPEKMSGPDARILQNIEYYKTFGDGELRTQKKSKV
ncbi:MAG: hypothetical protein HY796_00620 [Elusimicrobia bacterium]|nr:hypothetical protein [Elusimicrobiota bacterium]